MFLKSCKKAAIFGQDEKELICEALVRNIDGDSLVLIVSGDYFDNLSSEMDITFFDELKGLVTIFCSLSNPKRYLEGDKYFHSLDCKLVQEVSVLQRRADIKADVHLPVKIVIPSQVDIPENFVGIEKRGDLTSVKATAFNLSAGGIFIKSNFPYPASETMRVFLILGHEKTVDLNLDILRIEKPDPDAKDQVFGYGCRFINISSSNESAIRSYVFRAQVNRRESYATI